MNVTATRTRTRNMQLDAATSGPARGAVTKEMKDLAAEFYGENATSNAARAKATKARSKLYAAMKTGDILDFQMDARDDKGNKMILQIAISAPEGETMDVFALYNIMDAGKSPENLKKFLDIVSVTKTSVEEHLGKNVVARIAKPCVGKENVSVSPVK